MLVKIEGLKQPVAIVFNEYEAALEMGTRKVVTCDFFQGLRPVAQGMAICNPSDTFNRQTGERLALERAFSASYITSARYNGKEGRAFSKKAWHTIRAEYRKRYAVGETPKQSWTNNIVFNINANDMEIAKAFASLEKAWRECGKYPF